MRGVRGVEYRDSDLRARDCGILNINLTYYTINVMYLPLTIKCTSGRRLYALYTPYVHLKHAWLSVHRGMRMAVCPLYALNPP